MRSARGPNRAPGRLVVETSNGAPTIATSGCHSSSCSGSVRNGRPLNVGRPAMLFNESCSRIPSESSRRGGLGRLDGVSVTASSLSVHSARRYRRRMTYAQGRTFYDADSHIMELPDWLVEYADPDVRDRIRPLYLGAAGKLADKAMRDAEARTVDRGSGAALEDKLLDHKGWAALGAFDPVERTRALDLLGFECQLVFSTFAPTQFLGDDPDLRLRRHPRPQPRDGRLLRGRPSPRARRLRAVGDARAQRARPSKRRSTSAAAPCCFPRCPSTACRRPPTPTTTRCGGRSKRATSRSCSTSAAADS